MGGLARKATIIEQLISNGDDPIILDAGDLFFKKDYIDPGVTLETSKINAEIIVECFNNMGCDAFSPGSNDFAAGISFVIEQYNKSNFPYVSCNIIDLNDKLLFKPYIIRESNNKNIGVIGLASFFESDGIKVLDPIASLESIITEVDEKSDFIILLFNSSQQDLNKLYQKNFPIDMILSSKGRTRSSDGGSQIPTFIAGDRGKILYKFNINIIDEELPIVDIAWCENTIVRINDRLDKMKQGDQSVDLYSLYKNDQNTLNRISNYESQLDKANQLMENAINSLYFDKIELGKTIYDRPDILKIVDKGKMKIKDITTPLLPPGHIHDQEDTQMDSKGRLPGDPHHGHNH